MKNSILLILAVICIAFVAVTFWKKSNSGFSDRTGEAGSASEKARISRFWKSYNEATQLRTKGKFASAVSLYRKALDINPEHEESLYYLGNCFFETGDYTKAIETYRQLVALNPGSQRGHSQLGLALSSLSPRLSVGFEEAAQSFRRTIEINREESGPFLRLGVLFFNQWKLEGAFRQFRTASGFGSPEAYFLAGSVRFAQRRYSEAADLFQEVLKIAAREEQITERGVLSEGDVRSNSKSTESRLAASALKSFVYLFWTTTQMGGYPSEVPQNFRFEDSFQKLWKAQDRTPLPNGEKSELGRGTWFDMDQDGDQDLVVIHKNQVIRFYENREGELVDISARINLAVGKAWDVCAKDVDGDSWPDLYVTSAGFLGLGTNRLYRNNGDWNSSKAGSFSNVTRKVGLEGERSTAGAVFLDYNRDGAVDLLEAGTSGSGWSALRLFKNQNGRFREHSRQAGLSFDGSATGLAVGDYDGDGFVDLAVLRWKRPVMLFRNLKGRSFEDVTRRVGLSQAGGNGFSILFLDYDRDTRPDLLVTHHAPYAMALRSLVDSDYCPDRFVPQLFRNRGDGTFEEVTSAVRLNRPAGVMQAAAHDVDGDGWHDLIFAAGGLDPWRLEPSLVYRNVQGQSFELMAYLPSLDHPIHSSGVVLSDYDKDGTVDLYLSGGGLLSLR